MITKAQLKILENYISNIAKSLETNLILNSKLKSE